MDNFSVDKMCLEEESSSSFSDGLSFIIDDSDDEIIFSLVEELLNDKKDVQHMTFLLQLRQVPKELIPSASRPEVKKRCIIRDREYAHDCLYKDYFM